MPTCAQRNRVGCDEPKQTTTETLLGRWWRCVRRCLVAGLLAAMDIGSPPSTSLSPWSCHGRSSSPRLAMPAVALVCLLSMYVQTAAGVPPTPQADTARRLLQLCGCCCYLGLSTIYKFRLWVLQKSTGRGITWVQSCTDMLHNRQALSRQSSVYSSPGSSSSSDARRAVVRLAAGSVPLHPVENVSVLAVDEQEADAAQHAQAGQAHEEQLHAGDVRRARRLPHRQTDRQPHVCNDMLGGGSGHRRAIKGERCSPLALFCCCDAPVCAVVGSC